MLTLALLALLTQADGGTSAAVQRIAGPRPGTHYDLIPLADGGVGRVLADDSPEVESGASEQTALDALNGYQKLTWGMSEAQVKKVFPSAAKRKGLLQVAQNVAGYPAFTGFQFLNKKLARVIVQFDLGKRNNLTTSDHYAKMRAALVSKYGEPTRTGTDLESDEDSAAWQGERTGIALMRDEGLIPLKLVYVDIEHLNDIDAPAEDAAKDL